MHGQCEFCDKDVVWRGSMFFDLTQEVPEVCSGRYADLAVAARGEYDGIFSDAKHWVLPMDLKFDDVEEN